MWAIIQLDHFALLGYVYFCLPCLCCWLQEQASWQEFYPVLPSTVFDYGNSLGERNKELWMDQE